MKITITCYARFRDVFGEVTTIDLPDKATISDTLQSFAKRAGPDADLLINSEGAIREYVMIMCQGIRILPSDADQITLVDGETIILFPPVSGG